MRFTLVIPSFNQAAYLDAALASAVSQTGVELELKVYDGGSTDGSREIIERYSDRLRYWRSESDNGQAAVLREGFSDATGEILGWLNSDDLLLPAALARVAEAFAGWPDVSVVYGDILYLDEAGAVTGTRREIEYDHEILMHGYCYLPQPATFFRRRAYEETNGIDPDLHCCMDYDLWLQLHQTGQIRHVPTLLAGVRQHEQTKTARLAKLFREEEHRLRERHLIPGAGGGLRYVYHRARRVWLRWRAGAYRPLREEERALCTPPPM